MAVHVRLLGTAYAGEPGRGLRLPSDKRGYLLVYLACSGDWVSRDRLALLFWPDADEISARRNLRQLLSRIRKLPLAQVLELTPSHIRWQVETDVAHFRQALAQTDYATAVTFYQGPLLLDFPVQEASGFEAWLELERENLHRAFHNAVLHHAQALEAAREYEAASEHLKKLLDSDPLAEDVLQRYLKVLYLCGQRDAALEAYERFMSSLGDELALEPLDTTQELMTAIRGAKPLVLALPPKAHKPSIPVRVLRPPRLVGREQACLEALAATAPVVLVAGEPGVGKTRFLQELLPTAAWAYCREGLESVPYAPLIAFIRTNHEHLPELGPYREDLARLVPEVAPDLLPAHLEPQMAKARLLEALARVKEPLNVPIVLDDLQWADAATLETLVFLASRGKGRCYGAYRSGEESPALLAAIHTLRAKGLVTVIPLDPLLEDALQALLADLIGSESGPALFSRWLWGRSGGNPLFALETLKSLFEAGVLRADGKGWHSDIDDVTRDYSELDIPPVVSEVIMRRVARLPARTVRVLQTAAVVQEGFDAKLLGQVSGLSEWAVLEALEEAEGAELIAGERFRHDLLRQAVYRALPERRKRLLHARVAEELADVADLSLLAEHWLQAGNPGRAQHCWREHALALRYRGLHFEAAAILERAATHAPSERERLRLQVILAEVLREMGRLEEAQDLAAAVLATEPELAVKAAALIAHAQAQHHRGHLEQTAEVLERCRPLVAQVDDPELRLDFIMLLAKTAKQQGRPHDALALVLPELERLRSQQASLRLVEFLTSAGVLYDDLERHEEALGIHREALELARALGARYQRIDVTLNLLHCYASLQQYEAGFALAETALTLGEYDNTPILRNNLAALYYESGRLEDALPHYQALVPHHDYPYLRAIALARCADIHYHCGRRGVVEPLLADAIAALDETDYAVAQARVLIAVLHLGSDEQVARVTSRLADLAHDQVPAYLRLDLERALASRSA